MALTGSRSLAIGTAAPHFALPDATTGATVTPASFAGKRGLLVMFLCNHCPYVKHIADGIAAFAREYEEKGLGIVAISSNDVDRYPADHPDRMKEEAHARGYGFPYVYDASQEIAKNYSAACTPEFFLFDHNRALVYHGRFDDSRPGTGTPVTGRELRAAADAVLAGKQPSAEQRASIGCSIKWRPGNEPR